MAEYIDREALVEHLNVLSYGRFTEMPLYMAVMGTINEIKKFPSVDIRPVVHGKWEERDCGLDVECKCSACGYKDFVEKYDRYWFNRNYCPNCGARMEGET